MHPKRARTDHDVHELIRERWSPRAFDAARPVPRDEWVRLFEAARWAPSSFNEQPWRFVVVDRQQNQEAWQRVLDVLTPRNQSWAAAAPVLVVVAVRPAFEQTGGENPAAWYDAGQAVAFLSLQATAQGLSLRQMEGFDRDRARAACRIPADYAPAVVIAIGYAGDPDSLTLDKHRAAERQPRSRRPMTEIVFENTWREAT